MLLTSWLPFQRLRSHGSAWRETSLVIALALINLVAAIPAVAQDNSNQAPASASAQANSQNDGTIRVKLPTVTVTAQKESDDVQDVPTSVTAVTAEELQSDGITSISEASQLAPNVFFNEFTARKLSNPRFRGIGSSPNNPGVTTYFDGVPQLNANSSNIELIDVDQIEFVRGPQSSLYGRNALGGVINVTSRRPSLTNWTGSLTGPFGNFSYGAIEGTLSGPVIADKLAVGVGFGYSGRNGYTVNDITGHDLDSRSASFGKIQALWMPSETWSVRGLFSFERARDGDYALMDLGALRANPHHAARDFEGYTHRDIVAPTIIVAHSSRTLDFSATTGYVSWQTRDLTDLDYTPLPLITRNNAEDDGQFTEEIRVSSAKGTALRLADRVTLKWQAGLFFFTQNYTQDAVNSYSPFVLSPFLPFAVDQHIPQSELDDHGVGVYGRGTFAFGDKLEAIVGLRGDHENKSATLNTYFSLPIAPPAAVQDEKSYNDVSPQFTVDYHFVPRSIVYGTATRGFKAGGFNASSPPGAEAYGPEHTWSYEFGVKTSWAGERVVLNGAVFHIDWDELQVNIPNPFIPAQFYIGNAGTATSNGFELELTARPVKGLDVFGGYGYTSAHFGSGSVSGGLDVSGNRISNMPDNTGNVGVQYSHDLRPMTSIYGRAEVVAYGDYQYDDANTAGQSAYAISNFRGGVRWSRLFVEGWIRNAFDTSYVLTAFAYPGLAPSGFIGETGAPRTYGIRAGVAF